MIQYLTTLINQNNPNLILSFGHSVGGFWGTDGDSIISSITAKLSDSVQEKIYEHTNFSPFKFGKSI